MPVTRIENACATGNDAIRNGVYGVASGLLDVVLVAGADKVRESSARGTFWEWMGLTRDMAWDYPIGVGRACELRAAREPLPPRVAGDP